MTVTRAGRLQYLVCDDDSAPVDEDPRWTSYEAPFAIEEPKTIWARAIPVWQAASLVTTFTIPQAPIPDARVTATEAGQPLCSHIFDDMEVFNRCTVYIAWDRIAEPAQAHTIRCLENEVETNLTFTEDDNRPFPRKRDLHFLVRLDGKLDRRHVVSFEIQQVPEPKIVTEGTVVTFQCAEGADMFYMWETKNTKAEKLADQSFMLPCPEQVSAYGLLT